MVVGVLGEVVQEIVALEVGQEHAQNHQQHMEDLSVLDLQKNSATYNHAQVINAIWNADQNLAFLT